jgi:putative transposase
VHIGVTAHPTAAWTVQQLGEAFPEDAAPRYLLHDRDHAFAALAATATGMGIHEIRTAPRSTWQNAYAERLVGADLSPRTVGRYLRSLRPTRSGRPSQRWATFVRNHANTVLACDFFSVITVRFRILYVFVVLDVGTRRIVHWNVTEHPTADWTIQQCRTAITGETTHRFLIHDRDTIYAPAVDRATRSMGLRVLKTLARTPQANAFCERLIGTIRRECLDWLIPLHPRHLRQILTTWVARYNRGRPHASLGPGIPEPSPALSQPEPTSHRLPTGGRVIGTPILNGLHHEYHLVREAA